MKALRVLHGPVEVAGVAGAIVEGLRRRGHDAELVVMVAPPFGMPCDRLARGYARRLREGLRAPLRYDVLHFHFNVTFCEGLDALWARIAGRPLALMHFHGDDCRRREVTFAHHPARARIYDASKRNERLTLRRTKLAGRLCDAAIVADFELLENVAPFFRTVYLVPPPLRRIGSPAPLPAPHPDGPVVLHAPSDPAIKGTDTIRQALVELAQRRKLRPRIVTGVPHAQLLREIVAADVVIDQLNSETISIFALETMALGRPILSEFRRELLHPLVQETPMIEIDPQTIATEVRTLLDDPPRLRRVAGEGPAFVSRVHASDRVAEAIELVYGHARDAPEGVFEAGPAGIRPLDRRPT